MPTALLSAYDKAGVVEFAAELNRLGWKILASGGTAKAVAQAGVAVTDVAVLIGRPILDHRVVTLSREIHAGLLARDTADDNAELARVHMDRIDLLYVDPYPMVETIRGEGVTLDAMLDGTDVGGPAMLIAGVKGRRFVVPGASSLKTALTAVRDGRWQTDDPLRRALWAKAVGLVARNYFELAQRLSYGQVSGMVIVGDVIPVKVLDGYDDD